MGWFIIINKVPHFEILQILELCQLLLLVLLKATELYQICTN